MRFTIRDILLVTVIVAILVAWWIDHRRLKGEVEELRSQVPVAGFDIQAMEEFQNSLVP